MRQKRTRVRILYVILLILIGITVGPLWFYGSRMMSLNRERLETQESILQTITSQSLSQVISLYMENLNQQLKEFFDTAVPLATQIPAAKYSSDTDLRVALEGFVADRPAVLYATVLNNQARGAQAQTRNFTEAGGPFLSRSLAAAFTAAQQGQEYRSNPITVLGPGGNDVVMVMAEPILLKNQFLGMVAAVVTLKPITQALAETCGQVGPGSLCGGQCWSPGDVVRSRQVRRDGYGGEPHRAEIPQLGRTRPRGGDLPVPLAHRQPDRHDARHIRSHAEIRVGSDCPTENQ